MIIWYPDEACLLFQVTEFEANMIRFHNRYWIKSADPLNPSANPIASPFDTENRPFEPPPFSKFKLTRFEILPDRIMQCKHPERFYQTQYPELFALYRDGFEVNQNMILEENQNIKIHEI